MDSRVTQYFSKYRWAFVVYPFATSVSILTKATKVGIISIEQCSVINNVCHDREGSPNEFFYVYACMFTDINMFFSLDKFTIDV